MQKVAGEIGDILISTKANAGRVGLVGEQVSENAIAGQLFSILRLKPNSTNITETFLFEFLRSPLGQLQIAAKAVGSTLSMIKAKDLASIKIPLVDGSEIEKANEIHHSLKSKFKQIKLLEQEMQITSNWLQAL